MTVFIVIGVVTTLLGILGILYCVREANAVRRLKDDADAARSRLNTLIAINVGAVGVSFLGLALVVVGIIL